MTETITIQDVYNELVEIKQRMVSREEVGRMLETLEILHNHKTMDQITASEEHIRSGRTKRVSSVKDLLADLK